MPCRKQSKTVMLSVFLWVLGMSSVHFVPQRAKIDGQFYGTELLPALIEEMKALGGNDFILVARLLLPGAPAHITFATVKLLEQNVPNSSGLKNGPHQAQI